MEIVHFNFAHFGIIFRNLTAGKWTTDDGNWWLITDAGALLTFGWGLYGQVCVHTPLSVVFQREQILGGLGRVYFSLFLKELYIYVIFSISLFFVKIKVIGRVLLRFWIEISPCCRQAGHGSTEDELSPCHVSTLGGLNVVGVAAGLWHTLCITDIGDVYAFGGNQFGQLGVGGNTAEVPSFFLWFLLHFSHLIPFAILLVPDASNCLTLQPAFEVWSRGVQHNFSYVCRVFRLKGP